MSSTKIDFCKPRFDVSVLVETESSGRPSTGNDYDDGIVKIRLNPTRREQRPAQPKLWSQQDIRRLNRQDRLPSRQKDGSPPSSSSKALASLRSANEPLGEPVVNFGQLRACLVLGDSEPGPCKRDRWFASARCWRGQIRTPGPLLASHIRYGTNPRR